MYQSQPDPRSAPPEAATRPPPQPESAVISDSKTNHFRRNHQQIHKTSYKNHQQIQNKSPIKTLWQPSLFHTMFLLNLLFTKKPVVGNEYTHNLTFAFSPRTARGSTYCAQNWAERKRELNEKCWTSYPKSNLPGYVLLKPLPEADAQLKPPPSTPLAIQCATSTTRHSPSLTQATKPRLPLLI